MLFLQFKYLKIKFMNKIIFVAVLLLSIGHIQAQGFLKNISVDAACGPYGYVFNEKYLSISKLNFDVNYQTSKRVSLHVGYSEGFQYYRNDYTKLSLLDGVNLGLGYYLIAPKDDEYYGALELRGKFGYSYIYSTDDIGAMYQIDLRLYTSKHSFTGIGLNHCFYEAFGNKATIYWLFGIRI
jgi:hypothetical protein